MSTNENSPVPGEAATSPAVPARRPALLEPQERGWVEVPELAGGAEPRSPRMSLSAYLHGLRRHWALATGLGLLCGIVAGLAVWFALGEQYTATAVFRIAMREPALVFETAETEMGRFTQAAFEIYRDTQAEYVKSEPVLTAAVRDPEVARLPIVARERFPVRWLRGELDVGFPRQAGLMAVSLTENDGAAGRDVAKLVNAVVAAYETKVLARERLRRGERLSELDKLYAEKDAELRKKMSELTQLAEALGTGDPEALQVKQQVAMRRFGDIQSQYLQTQVLLQRARLELGDQQTQLANIESVPVPQMDVEEYVEGRALTRDLSRDLAARMMALAQTQANINPRSGSRYQQRRADDVEMLRAEIAALGGDAEQKIREKMASEIGARIRELEGEIGVLSKQEQDLEQRVQEQEKELDRLSTSSIDLEMMRSDIEQLNQVLAGIADEREKLNVELQADPRVELDHPAEKPETASNWTARYALSILAMLVGLCVPIGCVAWWDTRAERVNSPADVSRRLGLTVLGSVPLIPGRVIRKLGSPSRRHQSWHLRLTESVDGIAARLLRQAELDETRVVLVSSAGGGEGKTTLATQLAMSLARNGRATALVDFDLRRPALDGVFGLPLEPGVSEVLRGEQDVSEVVRETGTDNLSVVTAGRWDRHALRALANGAAGSLFEALRAECEFVVVDAAPILPVADTRFVSQHADGVILSVFRDVSRSPKIMAACEILEAFGVRTVEAVVTGPSDTFRDRDLRYEPQASA